MNSLFSSFGKLSQPVQAVLMLSSGGLIAVPAVLAFTGNAQVAMVVVIGLAVIAMLLVAYRAILQWRQKMKAAPFLKDISESSSVVPKGAGDAAGRARLDDLRKKFEQGLSTFSGHGKNIYSIPWYAIVGESGSGKTQLIRHSNIGFPPGLQDERQGVGGTINMDWWFTDHAVILDTAGRMLFDDVDSPTSTEWKEFLKLLAKHRRNCPVNGLLLTIPADSLIKDSVEAIEQKAGKLARQLDNIQRALGVRFPVFIVVTKSDLINGFREFFDDIADPQLQHQMLGWSNPEPLDAPFDVKQIDQYLAQIRSRLIRRRLALLRDPVHTEDQAARRIDQVDSLFAFPDSMAALAPRLRRYLELIFVGGTWATKPLFFRGIYFASSMREGNELDEELAKLHGVAVASLPGGGGSWVREKAYFIRDLFLSKVFAEKGLVTSTGNTKRQQTRRKTILYAGFLVGALLAVGMTWMAYRGLTQTISGVKDFWVAAEKAYVGNTTDRWSPVVLKEWNRKPHVLRIGETEGTPIEGKNRLRALVDVYETAKEPISTGAAFFLAATFTEDITNKPSKACRVIFERSLLQPSFDAVRQFVSEEESWSGTAAPKALAQLLQVEVRAVVPKQAAETKQSAESKKGAQPLQLDAMFKYIAACNEDQGVSDAVKSAAEVSASDVGSLHEALDWLDNHDYEQNRNAGVWPCQAPMWSAATAHPPIISAMDKLDASVGRLAKNGMHSRVEKLCAELKALKPVEEQLQALAGIFRGSRPADAVPEWKDKLAETQVHAGKILGEVKLLEGKSLSEFNAGELGRDRDALKDRLKELADTGLNPWTPPKEPPAAQPPKAGDLVAHQNLFLRGVADRINKLSEGLNSASWKEQDLLIQDYDAAFLNWGLLTEKDRRVLEIRLGMYDEANKMIAAGDTKNNGSASSELTLVHSLAELKALGQSAHDNVDSGKQTMPQTVPLCKNAWEVSDAALIYGERMKRETFVSVFLKGANPPGGLMNAISKREYGRFKDLKELQAFPAIPLTALDKEKPEPSFHPDAATGLLEDWHEAGRILVSKDQSDAVVDQAKLKTQYDNARPDMDAYFKEYSKYWILKVRDRGSVSANHLAGEFTDWGKLKQAVNEIKSRDVIRDLIAQNERLLAALSALGKDESEQKWFPADRPRIKEELATELKALKSQDLERDADSMLDSWVRLGDDAIKAKSSILNLDDRALQRGCFRLFHEQQRNATSPDRVEYWSSLALSIVTHLAMLTTDQATSAKNDLLRNYARFPLCCDSKEPPLTLDELNRARNLIEDNFAHLTTGNAGAGSSNQSGRFETLPSEIKEQLDRMLSPSQDGHFRTWISTIQSVLKFMFPPPPEKLKCELVIIDDPKLTDPNQPEANSNFSVVRDYGRIQVVIINTKNGQRDRKPLFDTRATKSEIGKAVELMIPDEASGVEFTFGDGEEGQFTPKSPPILLKAPWTGLLACQCRDGFSFDSGPDGKLRRLRLEFVDKGKPYHFWIGVRFKSAPPEFQNCSELPPPR